MSLLHIAGGATEDKLYPEDVFSTYLYTGNGSTQTINNGIDLAGKGGMVWTKRRTTAIQHAIFDTARGVYKSLASNTTGAQSSDATSLTAFSSNGFTVGSDTLVNGSDYPIASWTFRKAPKFFDVVTYTGNGVAGRQIPHSLGCEVGMVIVKSSDNANGASQQWQVWHRSRVGEIGLLNTTGEFFSSSNFGEHTTAYFVTATSGTNNNVNGTTYVAYLFAHDPSADGIIQCGSYVGNGNTTTGVGQQITLGFEPQYVMIKRASNTGSWKIFDVMRGFTTSSPDLLLEANTNYAETNDAGGYPTSTGFAVDGTGTNNNGDTYIYLAIRRPMKVPTSGTEVYNAVARTGTGTAATVTGVGFAPDLVFTKARNTDYNRMVYDRMRSDKYLVSNTTEAETSNVGLLLTDVFSTSMNGIRIQNSTLVNSGSWNFIDHFFRRAKGFMDIVCYTGTGVARTVNHNLGVVPELMIVKSRSSPFDNWPVYNKTIWSSSNTLYLNLTNGTLGGVLAWYSAPTESVFYVGTASATNASAATYVAYLFASCPNVSKVGSYTGNGTTQTINCGFTTGARFVLCKRTDSTGDWFVWDTARGIVAANDPHLSLNTTAAEVTTDDSIDPASSGFIVNQNTATNINVNGGSYIYLAIA